jgi:voltage-gated potassium channel
MSNINKQEETTFSLLNLVVLVLSVYVLISMIFQQFIVLPQETSKILDLVDNVICIFFLIEFFIRFFKSENKMTFMKWGWIDFISSIPTFDILRVGRLFRLFRILRILRALRSTKHIISFYYQNKARNTFSLVLMTAFLTIIFCSLTILQVETDPNSNIKTAEDAIWWSYCTITTVGYGDRFPVTTEGRIIGGILMTVGIALFGTFTSLMASKFCRED